MQGTIHRLLLEEKESEFKTGSVLLLKQVRKQEIQVWMSLDNFHAKSNNMYVKSLIAFDLLMFP